MTLRVTDAYEKPILCFASVRKYHLMMADVLEIDCAVEVCMEALRRLPAQFFQLPINGIPAGESVLDKPDAIGT